MKLFAFNINTCRCGNSSVTVEAHFVDFDSACARVFDLFNLIGSWFTKPFISYSVVRNDIPNAFSTSLGFVFFTGIKGKYHNGNGYGYFFHVFFLMWLIASKIIARRVGIARITRNASFNNSNCATARILHFSNLSISRPAASPKVNRRGATLSPDFHGFIITGCIFFLFTGNRG
jgi:hypothetical protein